MTSNPFGGIIEAEKTNEEENKLVLSHYPILMWKDQHRGSILLYGHTHNTVEDTFFQKCIAEMNADEALNLRRRGGKRIHAINVGACMPWINYEPRTLEEILAAVEQGANNQKSQI